jgi:hypothetical protein
MYICNTYNFGDRHRLGITFELAQETKLHHGSYLWGSVCYWIFGKCIGDMQYGISLSSDCWGEMEYIIKNSGKHDVDTLLFSADGSQIFQTMQKDIENEADDIVEKNQFGFVGTYDFWGVFRVSLELDIMQEYTILLFEYNNKARIIVGYLNKKTEYYEFQFEHFLERGEFDTVLQEAFDWLKKRYEEEVEKEKMENITIETKQQ